MVLKDFIIELKNWKLTRYKLVNFSIGSIALLLYEFIGRPFYRPFIYKSKINDFHIADTLGNTLGTIATVFFFVAVLSNDLQKGNYLVKLISISVLVFELIHPLFGKSIDLWDVIATIITGFFCSILFNFIFRVSKKNGI